MSELDTLPAKAVPVPSLPVDEPGGPGQERHIPELDGLRGLAVLAVLFHHIAQGLIDHEPGSMHALMNLTMFGFLGVDVFFALSGFLITRILLRKREQQAYYRNFYGRRILRLMPPYLLTLVIVAILIPGDRGSLLLSLVYLANFTTSFHVAIGYGILWSLSIEEQFYLVWPTLLRRVSTFAVAWIAFLIGVLTPLARTVAALHGGFDHYATWYRLDGLAWGALLACLLSLPSAPQRVRTFRIGAAWLSSLLGVVGVALWGTGSKELGTGLLFTAVSLGTVAIISSALRGDVRRWALLRSKPLRFFGDISYWMYLIHALFLIKFIDWLVKFAPNLMRNGGLTLWLLVTGVVLALSVSSGVAVRQWIELPTLRRKSRFG